MSSGIAAAPVGGRRTSARPMLTGARQRTTGTIGQRSTPTQSTVTSVTASGPIFAGRRSTAA